MISTKQASQVAVIGAGIAGINAGILLPAKVPGILLTIFDKNADVGGTWFENKYPGVRCDIPAHVYQSTFSPNTKWSEEYAQGAEIRDYWQGVAKKYDVYKYLKLRNQITQAVWDDEKKVWVLDVKSLETNATHEEEFDVVVSAIGRFNAWKLPDYPGIKEFKGLLRHSSDWDSTFEPKGKRVAVIGNGASGVQLVPNLQKVVSHLDHYARSKTWIANSFNGGPPRTLEPNYYAKELIESFDDPEVYHQFRKALESSYYKGFSSVLRGTEQNMKLREDFIQLMTDRVAKKPELINTLIPDFAVNCRRLTPGPGYLEALAEDNVTFVQNPISHFTAEGIVDSTGVERKVDAVFCSTGANVDMLPPFPIIAHSTNLRSVWTPDPITYLGVATPNFPNFLFIHGPNGAGFSGTIPNQVETQTTYVARLLRKVSSQHITTFAPSQAATNDFITYSDAFFPRTVWTENCSSWANGGKAGARIHGHWPGSASHCNAIRAQPRWEDWEWTYGPGGRFGWFGNGFTSKEERGEGDLTGYLKVGEVDLRAVHEEWFEGLD